MRAFLQKSKTTQSATPAKSTNARQSHVGRNRQANSIAHLQRTITHLQGSIGNQAAQRLMRSEHKGSTAGASSHSAHNAPGEASDGASSSVTGVLRSRGQPLEAAVRTAAEADFGHRFDFSQVRVHADAAAGESARAINAAAFTVGQHIVFAPGRYKPKSSGRKLLIHELVHTVQQRKDALMSGGRSGSIQRADSQRSLEHEADRQAANVVAGARAKVRPGQAPAMVQMQEDTPSGESQRRRARITEQDANPEVGIFSIGNNEHSIVVGEAGEISLNLELTRSENVSTLRIRLQVDNGESRFLVDYIDVGEAPTLVIRTVNVPEGAIAVRLSASTISGQYDENTILAQGRLEILA